ncbi:MFS transporter [Mycolicibacterium mageritense DSM 44476 = CIP 104973]|uniref:MFS transporter n=1 Tax=Mycolicibacterium mageritense TaxID=53462 RepID=A0ABN5YG25_MYCME|nr:MFS transporter [Mycolicibacterium mageritense]MCC9179255.1 MFS transporter [Mycolicibacterium mageritense]TXI63050.1 MAG: MFS transporter [Mycolicibacterium mageritense]BBX37034.1 MFS transporter [Mycolicibacterium mageritense]CDO26663.1 major facilitator superfamily protein transporter [Mycolicibacterium mageritense DSM 44476 = CIP 104973]
MAIDSRQILPTSARGLRKIVTASSLGTLIEWYDFYIYGSLAVVFSGMFFPNGNTAAALLVTVAAFGTGFVVRPIGAVVFGRMGDRVGRKKTFLTTLLIMGGATTLLGLLPTYEHIGLAAPLLLVLLRLLQGLAIGGEYGGAAIYIAEHAPERRRGMVTSFLQTTATGGLILSIGVIVSCRLIVGEANFEAWGWRIPFLLSAVLVLFSLKVRLKMHESPVFEEMRQTGRLSQTPVKDAVAQRPTLGLLLTVLFGLTAGLGVAWYTSQFYSLYFLQTILDVDFLTANLCVGVALVVATPFFVVFGRLSDQIGRVPVIVTGLLCSAAGCYPLFAWVRHAAVHGHVGQMIVALTLQVVLVAAIYGPVAAFLTELFPPQIRYTGLSLAYHVGTGVFGGFTPLIALSLNATLGSDMAGLIYPIAVTAVTAAVFIGLLRRGPASPVVVRAWAATDTAGTSAPDRVSC